ncbi:unnamed protein product [Danaus chrysippus]|uniref:(African queen) hypothetical protein n=1 Tax=Danaus chrysippus TaxID=151541 RepID=A0A8J2W3B9_9NEOP|nr:unnamed protein product [Danaus chrysippus]
MKFSCYFILIFQTIVTIRTFTNAIQPLNEPGKDYYDQYGIRDNGIFNQRQEEKTHPKDAELAQKKAEVIQRAKAYEKQFDELLSRMVLEPENTQRYRRDPVLNMIRRRHKLTRRKKDSSVSTDTVSSSSSLEIPKWKEEWKEHWLHKKLDAINHSLPKGDIVNMVAARPWGVPCGDPNQFDLPWGSCMLPMECEAEYRIYRGDYFCGRTKFICCALQITNYDLYGGFDVSFADSSLATDSEEKRNKDRGSKERKRRKRIGERKKRLRQRMKRKRRIKRTIRRIIREIRKILNRSFRNGTTARKRKTKQLKKFIKDMKKQYIKERKAVKDIHEMELIKIDAALQKRLTEIRGVNQEFIKNSTFRDIVVNGTINKQNARILMDAYPELKEFLQTRRKGVGENPRDHLDYDIEYGYLYY